MIVNVATGAGADTPEEELLRRLRVADGYRISIFARGMANPRMMLPTSGGRLLVSSPRSGEVVQLRDTDGDGAADRHEVLLSGLKRPHGLDLYDGYLYIAESHQVGRVPYDPDSGGLAGDYEPLIVGLTDDGNHWSKTIRFDAAGNLYLAMGSTCNVCLEEDERRATIMRFDADGGGGGRVYASGLRNSVGMAFAPWNGALYATDNGRDLLGDDYPPCELNLILENGFYGWPFLNGDNEPDPDFGAGNERYRETSITPAFSFRAHNAPLGIYFPGDGSRSALVALHGSWNRSTPDGYKVLRLHWDAGESIRAEDFMWGFERDGDIVGRPVDVTGDGEGGFFVSDDYARVIYRVSTRGDLKSATAPRRLASATEIQVDSALAEAGGLVYARYPCAQCHDPGAPDTVRLDQLERKYDPESLADFFVTPTPPMPDFRLGEAERRQLAHFLLSRSASPAER